MHQAKLSHVSTPLTYMLTYAVVSITTGIQIAKALRKGYSEITALLVELPGAGRP